MRRLLSKIIGAVMMVTLLAAPVMPMVMSDGGVWAVYDEGGGSLGGGAGGGGEGGGSLGGGEGAFDGDREHPPAAATGPDTSILPADKDIPGLLKIALNILVYGLGAAATLGVVVAGIMYLTARDSEAQVAKAKTRLIEIVIGLVAWAFMAALLNWLIPGGLTF